MLWYRCDFQGAKLSTLQVQWGEIVQEGNISPAFQMKQMFTVHLGNALFSFVAFPALEQN